MNNILRVVAFPVAILSFMVGWVLYSNGEKYCKVERWDNVSFSSDCYLIYKRSES